MFSSFANSLFVLQSVQMCPAVFHIYFVSTALILLVPLASLFKFSLPYNKAGRAGVLSNFIFVFFKVLCGVVYCLYCQLFSNSYSICYQCPLLFHNISNFLSS